MLRLTSEFIRRQATAGDYELSLHADEERLAEGLTIEQLEEVLTGAELIEDYPDDPRGASCLVLGTSAGRSFHVVCGLTRQGRLLVITVYEPTLPKWLDPRTRQQRADPT